MSDVLKVALSARVKLTKNTNRVLHDQIYQPADDSFTVYAGQAVTVNTNTSRALETGAIAAAVGRHVLVQVDQPVRLRVNGGSTDLNLLASGSLFIANGSVTALKVFNDSTTNIATVNYLITD